MAEVSKSTGNYPLMTEDETILSMIDSNLHREKISFSEKAFAYKMKNDVLKKIRKKKGQIDHKTKKKSKDSYWKLWIMCRLCFLCHRHRESRNWAKKSN